MLNERLYSNKYINDIINFARNHLTIDDWTFADFREEFSREPWWAEFWSGFACFGWALISIIYNTQFRFSPVFFQLTLFASAEFWEATGIIVGILQVGALLSGKIIPRWCAAFIASWWWSFLSICIFQNEPTPSLALYCAFAFINLVSMVRLARAIK